MNSQLSSHQIPELQQVLIDGFRYNLECSPAYYILTHFHSDHYGGLSSTFNRGTIICTPITARLITKVLRVNPALIQIVEYNESIDILGTRIHFLDANHCPGAAILLVSLPNGLNYIHTGDMRYHPNMKQYPLLQNTLIDKIYLDTTYAHPKHAFLDQDAAIREVVDIATEFFSQEPRGVLLLCAYNLGKEKLICAVIDAISNNAYIDEDKLRIFQCLGSTMTERIGRGEFVTDKSLSRFHICKMGLAGSVMPFFKPSFENLEVYRNELITDHGMDVSKLQCIVPTGWAAMGNFNKANARVSSTNSIVQLVPYSEHSNFKELQAFVKFIKPREVIPTVFNGEDDRLRILELFRNDVNMNLCMKMFIKKMTSAAAPRPEEVVKEVWACVGCTYLHRREEEMGFLCCAVCGHSRVAADSPSTAGQGEAKVVVSKMSRKRNIEQSSTSLATKDTLKKAPASKKILPYK